MDKGDRVALRFNYQSLITNFGIAFGDAIMQIHHLLENSVDLYPDREAVWFCGEWKSYAEIEEMANSVANYLVSVGVERGDRVAILYDNSFEYIASYFGILKAGAVTVGLNTETTANGLAYLLEHSNSKVIICQSRYVRYLQVAADKTTELKHAVIGGIRPGKFECSGSLETAVCLGEVFENGDKSRCAVRSIDIDLASIVYTSGSTGKPKGVMLTHQNVVNNTKSIAKYLKLTKDDRVMVVLPFYYIYGQSLLTTHFYVSGSVVIDRQVMYPQRSLEVMRDMEVTGFAGVPSTFLIMLDRTSVRKFDFPKLRYVTQAGGAMAAGTQKQVADVFDKADVYIMYGATEAAPRLSYVPPEKLNEKWGSIGIAVDNVEVFVADEDGERMAVGEEGEIVARGSNIMAGYWRDAEGTAEVLRNGLYYTGDLGVMDEDGYIFIVGRKKEIIKTGGFRVSSKEIEEALLEHSDIHEAAVVGVADEILGEAIKAFVVPKAGMTICLDMLKGHLKELLPAFKHPRYIEVIESLPKNKSGKVIKGKLI